MNKQNSLITIATFLTITLLAFNVYGQDTEEPAATAPAAAPASATSEHVARAVFTSGVQNREPTDTITSISNDKNQIYFFTELSGLGGQTVVHRWEYQGKTMSEVKFNVGGPRWRVWSNKTLLPQWTGEWRVSIIDGEGNKVGEASFNYTGPTEEPKN